MSISSPASPLAAQAAPFTVTLIGQEHRMLQFPGGVFAMGSKHIDDRWHDAPPHMVRVNAVRAGIALVSERQYRKTMKQPADNNGLLSRIMTRIMRQFGFADKDDLLLDRPARSVNWFEWEEYMRQFNLTVPAADRIGFLTEAAGEYVARGGPKGVVDVRKFQEEQDLRTTAQLIEHLRANEYYLENFIDVDPIADPERALKLGTNICTDIHSEQFQALMRGTGAVFAWYGFATTSGRPVKGEEAWSNKDKPVPESSSLNEHTNVAGIVDALGSLHEWREDVYARKAYSLHDTCPVDPINPPTRDDRQNRVVRGGGLYYGFLGRRVASRSFSGPNNHSDCVGCRLAAAPVPEISPS